MSLSQLNDSLWKDVSRCNYYKWPSLSPYTFPPVVLLPQVIKLIREDRRAVLLMAPLWQNQSWLPELMQLLAVAPWPIPLRKDPLSQAKGMTWQPNPSCGPSMAGPSIGDYGPPRESLKYYF